MTKYNKFSFENQSGLACEFYLIAHLQDLKVGITSLAKEKLRLPLWPLNS